MSIINQMLKDMEARKSGGSGKESKTPLPTDELKSPKKILFNRSRILTNKIKMGLLIILLVILLALLIRLMLTYSNHQKHQVILSADIKSTPSAANQQSQQVVALVPQNNQATLSDVAIQNNGNITSLIFVFDKPASYRLEQNDSKNTVTLSFTNTKLTAQLPAQFVSSAITNLSAQSTASGDVFIINLEKGTTVLGVLPQADNPNRIILSLESAPPATSKASATEAANNTSTTQTNQSDEQVTKVAVPMTDEQQAEKQYDAALAELNDGSFQMAVQYLQQALEVKPDYLPAQQALITVLLQENEYSLADQYLNQALEERPENIDLLQLKARLQLLSGKTSAALKTLQSFSPPLTDNPDYYALIAVVQQRLGNYEMAAGLYKQILMVQPSNAKWWMGLGIALESQHQSDEAIVAYQHAVALGSLDPNLQAYVTAKISKLSDSGSQE